MVYTIKQVADRWGCHRDSVLKATKNGLKYFKVGREYKIRKDWLEEFENKQGGTP